MNLPAITFHPPLAVSGVEIVVVVLFVVGGLLKSLFDKAVSPGGKGPTMTTPPLVPPRPSVSSEEERARRLMEALGLPGSPPPAPLPPVAVARPVPPPLPPNIVVTRRAVPPPLPLAPLSAPPRFEPQAIAQRRRPDPDPTLRRGPSGASPTGQAVRPSAPTTSLRGLLRTSSRAELRRAILLREVLGPPRALAEVGEGK